jgi:prepilin-type N-terminal cleavage/methylation domain-containing protein
VSQRGFTLTESLVALSILGIALAGILPSFLSHLDANSLTEERSAGVAAAQQVMEGLRHTDPASMPSSGKSAVQLVTVGNREYEVLTHYCVVPKYCDADSRHILIEVGYGGQTIYTLETVFTQLR